MGDSREASGDGEILDVEERNYSGIGRDGDGGGGELAMFPACQFSISRIDSQMEKLGCKLLLGNNGGRVVPLIKKIDFFYISMKISLLEIERKHQIEGNADF